MGKAKSRALEPNSVELVLGFIEADFWKYHRKYAKISKNLQNGILSRVVKHL